MTVTSGAIDLEYFCSSCQQFPLDFTQNNVIFKIDLPSLNVPGLGHLQNGQ